MREEVTLQNRIEEILEFLKLVHPGLTKESGYLPCVEIRPIARGKDAGYYRPVNLWKLDEAGVKKVRALLEKTEGKKVCIYYSVYTFDNNREGEKSRTISRRNAVGTEEIALDFDHVDLDGFKALSARFDQIGIKPVWVFTGHGYQAHILLDRMYDDLTLLEQFVTLFTNAGFACDPHCIDPARVMRLPGTVNCKCFDDDSLINERENPPVARLVDVSGVRYSVEQLYDVFSKAQPEPLSVQDASSVKAEKEKPNQQEDEAVKSEVASIRRLAYPYISGLDLPEPVRRMLSSTRQGYRNKVQGFLENFLKNTCGLSYEQVREVIALWNEKACNPPLSERELTYNMSRFFFEIRLPFDKTLAKEFGVIDFEGLTIRRGNEVRIPNAVFKGLDKMNSTDVKAYLVIKLIEHGGESATHERIKEMMGVSSDSALQRTLAHLKKLGHVYVKKGRHRAGEATTYKSSHIQSRAEGYCILTANDLYAFITELVTPGKHADLDLKLYTYFVWRTFGDKDKPLVLSLTYLADVLDVTKPSIIASIKRLEEKKYIRKDKSASAYMPHNEYTLLR